MSEELDILGKAFEREIDGALCGHNGLLQTKSKVAEKLVADGYLAKREYVIGIRFPVTVSGYELTHAGRIAYCDSDRCMSEGDL